MGLKWLVFLFYKYIELLILPALKVWWPCLLLQLPVWWLYPQWQCVWRSEGAQKCPQCYSHPVLHRRRVPGEEAAPLILPHSCCLTVSPLNPPPPWKFFFLIKPSTPSLFFFVSFVKVEKFCFFSQIIWNDLHFILLGQQQMKMTRI